MKSVVTKVLIKRITMSLVLLFLLITLIFFLLRISPGNPVQKFVSPLLSPNLVEKVKNSFSLDKSVWLQYTDFVKNLATGNFGISYQYHLPVISVIFTYLPFTIIFSLISFLFQISFGLYSAIKSFNNKGKLIDKILSKSSLVIYSIPSFVIGIFLIYIFSVKLNLFPSADLRSIDFSEFTLPEQLLDYIQHLILPVLTLSLPGIVIYYKYLRENLESINNEGFIRYLRANGISEKIILKKHLLPNAIRPMIAVAGIELGLLLSGALITEVIFSLPGMGRLTVNAILNRDYPLVIGCTFISGILIILTNFIADIVSYKIDKRMIKGL
ncbi:glutathione transport system permease protein GsiC [bacterium BMS3Abin04]|nr:glutathione transport system permease protein GsiC [bacterium BMS3Abin04]